MASSRALPSIVFTESSASLRAVGAAAQPVNDRAAIAASQSCLISRRLRVRENAAHFTGAGADPFWQNEPPRRWPDESETRRGGGGSGVAGAGGAGDRPPLVRG